MGELIARFVHAPLVDQAIVVTGAFWVTIGLALFILAVRAGRRYRG